jgi:hypothetical protein
LCSELALEAKRCQDQSRDTSHDGPASTLKFPPHQQAVVRCIQHAPAGGSDLVDPMPLLLSQLQDHLQLCLLVAIVIIWLHKLYRIFDAMNIRCLHVPGRCPMPCIVYL